MDKSGVHLWLVLWKAYEAVGARAERSIASLDMCMSDFGILEILLNKGPLPINDIGRKLSLTSGAITTAVDRLEKRKLVERTLSATDRRARIVNLTKAGHKLISGAFDEHAAHMEDVFVGLSASERGTLLSLLKKVGKAAVLPVVLVFSCASGAFAGPV